MQPRLPKHRTLKNESIARVTVHLQRLPRRTRRAMGCLSDYPKDWTGTARHLLHHADARRRFWEAHRGLQKPKPKPKTYTLDPRTAAFAQQTHGLLQDYNARVAAGQKPNLAAMGAERGISVGPVVSVVLSAPPPRLLSKAEVKALTKTARCEDCDHRARDHVTDGCTAENEEGGVCVCKTSRADVLRAAEVAAEEVA